MIDVSEGQHLLAEELTRTFGIDAGVFETDEGKKLLANVTLIFARFVHFNNLMHTPIVESKFMTQLGSLFFKEGHSNAYTRAKELADLLLRYEYTEDNSIYDDKPEGQAVYHVNEFIENGLRDVDEIVTDFLKESGTESVFQFKLAAGNAGTRFILAEQIICSGSAVRVACGNRKTYTNIIESIIFSS